MSYRALYRSYRPKMFEEVAGQEHIIKTLKNALISDKVSHAYLFSGLRGIGKTTIARILAKAVNCLDLKNGEPCEVCQNCKLVKDNATTDIIELDAASNNGVEEMRSILDKVSFLPSVLKKKVYIIDEAHMLSISAFNALLKTLEEPPKHVMFILATTEPHKIPQTIMSRCQRFDFKQLSIIEIKSTLKKVVEKEKIIIDDNALSSIAESAEGSLRDALGTLDQCRVYNTGTITPNDVDNVTGRISNYKLIELIASINEKNANQAIKIINELLNSGKEVSKLVNNIVQFCRDILLYKSNSISSEEKYIYRTKEFQNIIDITDEKEIFYYIDIFVDIQNKIRFTNSPKILLEVSILKIINSVARDLEILERLQSLESRSVQSDGGVTFIGSDFDNKVNSIENRLKRIQSDIVQFGIPDFKEKIEAKINLLEEVSLNVNKVPDTYQNRIDYLENKLNEFIDTPNAEVNVNNFDYSQTIDEIKTEIQSIKENTFNLYDNHLNELSDRMTVLEKATITGIDHNRANAIIDESEIINNITEKVNTLEDCIDMLNARLDDISSIGHSQFINNSTESNNFTNEEIKGLRDNYLFLINKIQSISEQMNEPLNNKNSEEFKNLTIDLISFKEEIALKMQEIQDIVKNKNLDIEEKILEYKKKIDDLVILVDGVKDYGFKLNLNLNNVQNDINNIQQQLSDISIRVEEQPSVKRNPFETNHHDEYTVKGLRGQPINNLQGKNEINNLTNSNSEINSKKENNQPLKYEVQDDNSAVLATPNTLVIKTPNNKTQVQERNDIINDVYNVKVIERVLHQSRESDCRTEKGNLISKWKTMEQKTPTNLLPIAKLLSMGELAANGRSEMLVIFPSASVCNHLMEPKNHNFARQVLKMTFGKDYDFMALPGNTWQEKRREYVGQYQIGIVYPVLSPINNPELRIVTNNNLKVLEERKNKPFTQAQKFFGAEVVESEE